MTVKNPSIGRTPYKGVFPVVPTTFSDDGELDLDSQKRCVDFMIDAGADGLSILANFSEQFVLSDEERAVLTSTILRHVNGRVPVIVTTTHFSTKICAERSRQAQEEGAAMVMIMPPYHGATVRVSTIACYRFFDAVSNALSIPIMIQDAPVSGTALDADMLAQMARDIEHVAYFKIETPAASVKLRELIRLGGEAVQGPWDGEEGITLIHDLEAGATGSMTGGAYPDGLGPVVRAYLAGRHDEARERYERWLPLINLENRLGWLMASKALMKEGGVIASEAPRHPLAPLHPEIRRSLIETARRLDPVVLRWGK